MQENLILGRARIQLFSLKNKLRSIFEKIICAQYHFSTEICLTLSRLNAKIYVDLKYVNEKTPF